MKKLASTISAVLLIAVLSVGLAAIGAAGQSSEDSDVTVDVESTTEVDVRPTSLSYSDLEPGDEATSDEEADGFTAVEVENIGSESIEAVWAEATNPGANPFGTGDSEAYNTGNFITISTDTVQENSDDYDMSSDITGGTSTNFHYANRYEFTQTPEPTYIQTIDPGDDGELQTISEDVSGEVGQHVGRFVEGDEWYYYTIYYDDDEGAGACDGNNAAEVWVGQDEHTNTELGTVDFTDEEQSEVIEVSEEAGDNIGTLSESVSLGDDLTYRLFAYCDDENDEDSFTVRTRFNAVPEISTDAVSSDLGIQDGAGARAILLGDDALEPGAYFPIDTTVKLPNGVVADEIEEGTLTLRASDDRADAEE